MHGDLGSSRIEENPHAATWGAGPAQEVIPQVGEMSFRRAGGICPHDGSEQGRGGSSSAPAPAPRGRCASAPSVADDDNVMLHLLTSRSGRDSAGSVTTGEERDRVDIVILF